MRPKLNSMFFFPSKIQDKSNFAGHIQTPHENLVQKINSNYKACYTVCLPLFWFIKI